MQVDFTNFQIANPDDRLVEFSIHPCKAIRVHGRNIEYYECTEDEANVFGLYYRNGEGLLVWIAECYAMRDALSLRDRLIEIIVAWNNNRVYERENATH